MTASTSLSASSSIDSLDSIITKDTFLSNTPKQSRPRQHSQTEANANHSITQKDSNTSASVESDESSYEFMIDDGESDDDQERSSSSDNAECDMDFSSFIYFPRRPQVAASTEPSLLTSKTCPTFDQHFPATDGDRDAVDDSDCKRHSSHPPSIEDGDTKDHQEDAKDGHADKVSNDGDNNMVGSADDNGDDDSVYFPPLVRKSSMKKSLSSLCSSDRSSSSFKRNVSFGNLEIRQYKADVSDHPSCSAGPPVQLSWEYDRDASTVVSVEDYEGLIVDGSDCDDHTSTTRSVDSLSGSTRPSMYLPGQLQGMPVSAPRRRRKPHQLLLSPYDRKVMLRYSSHDHCTKQEIKRVTTEAQRVKKERVLTKTLRALHMLDDAIDHVKTSFQSMFNGGGGKNCEGNSNGNGAKETKDGNSDPKPALSISSPKPTPLSSSQPFRSTHFVHPHAVFGQTMTVATTTSMRTDKHANVVAQ